MGRPKMYKGTKCGDDVASSGVLEYLTLVSALKGGWVGFEASLINTSYVLLLWIINATSSGTQA